MQKLIGLSDLYAYIRRTESASNRRTAALDQPAARMQAAGREGQFDPAEVSIWFHEGTNALRVVALNLMLARAECRDFLAVLKAVDEPRSLLEQFCGLLLADAIGRAQRKRRFRRGPPLMSLSNMILSELEIT